MAGKRKSPRLLLHEGYEHNCVDIEFVETAQMRNEWAFAHDSIVEHLHPRWGKGQDDDTYRRGDRTHLGDLRLLQRRRRLWGMPPRGNQMGARRVRASVHRA